MEVVPSGYVSQPYLTRLGWPYACATPVPKDSAITNFTFVQPSLRWPQIEKTELNSLPN